MFYWDEVNFIGIKKKKKTNGSGKNKTIIKRQKEREMNREKETLWHP
jgi:hypothetical protein